MDSEFIVQLCVLLLHILNSAPDALSDTWIFLKVSLQAKAFPQLFPSDS
jgi:hypothetical protein